MSNTLRDQLLKAGLIDEKRAKQATKEKLKERKRLEGQKTPAPVESAHARAQQAQADKAERDRQLNQQRQAEAERRALKAQVRQLIETHRIPKGESELPFHFIDGDKVKRLYVSAQNRAKLAQGLLAIVRLDQDYELVTAEVADKIRTRDAHSVVLHHPRETKEKEGTPDDPYAAYPVPDDLIW